MKSYFPILFKWTSFFSLLLIPYYIHCSRIDRILNHYTQKSNAIYIIIHASKSDMIQSLPTEIIMPHVNQRIERAHFVILYIQRKELESIPKTKNFYLNSDIQPPNLNLA
jgi:hypothetical protein